MITTATIEAAAAAAAAAETTTTTTTTTTTGTQTINTHEYAPEGRAVAQPPVLGGGLRHVPDGGQHAVVELLLLLLRGLGRAALVRLLLLYLQIKNKL